MNILKDPRTNWKFIWIVVILGVLAGVGILSYSYWCIKDLETKLTEIETRLPVIKPPEEKVEDEIADYKSFRDISFLLPERWEIISQDPGEIYIILPEVNFAESFAFTPSIGAELVISIGQSNLAVAECDPEVFGVAELPYVSDFKCTQISDKKAVSYHVDYEGHYLIYITVHKGFEYVFSLGTWDLEEEAKHLDDFEFILNSVKFL